MQARNDDRDAARKDLMATLAAVADPNGTPDDVVTALLNVGGALAKDTRDGAGGRPIVASGTTAFAVATTSVAAMERLLALTTAKPVYGMIFGRPVGVALNNGLSAELTILTRADYKRHAMNFGLPAGVHGGASPGAVGDVITRTRGNFVDSRWRVIDYDGEAEVQLEDIRYALTEAMPELGGGAALAYRSASHRALRNQSKWHMAMRVGAASSAGRKALKRALDHATRTLEQAGHGSALLDPRTLDPVQLIACGGPRVPEPTHLDAGLRRVPPPAGGNADDWAEVDVERYNERDAAERRHRVAERNKELRKRLGVPEPSEREDRWCFGEANLAALFERAEAKPLHHQDDFFPLIAAVLWAWGLERGRREDAVFVALREYVVTGRRLRHPELTRTDIVEDLEREWLGAEPNGSIGADYLVQKLTGSRVYRPPVSCGRPGEPNPGRSLGAAEAGLRSAVRRAINAGPGSTTLIAATEGLGKTRASVSAVADRVRQDPALLAVIAVPTRRLGDEVLARLRQLGIAAVRWRVYEEQAEDREEPMCLRLPVVEALREARLPIKPNACEAPPRGERPRSVCPPANRCAMTRQRAARPNVLVVTHAALFIASEIWRQPDLLIFDESFVGASFEPSEISGDDLDC